MPVFYSDKGFFKAIAKGDVETVESYLSKWKLKGATQNPCPLDAITNDMGDNPLHAAGSKGNLKIISMLLATGMNINARNSSGNTPLMQAVRSHNQMAAEALLVAGGDFTITDNSGNDPLYMAVQRRMRNTAELLLAKGATVVKDTMLTDAASHDDAKLVKMLIDAGAKVDVRDSYSRTAATLAGQNGNLEMIETLAEAKADLNLRDGNGNTPLHTAISNNRIVVVERLVELGARLDLKDNSGQTPLQLAKSRDATRIIEILTDADKTAAAAAMPMPASIPANTANDNSGGTEQWVLMGEARVGYIGNWPGLGRKLTEIFNFESRERLTITENLKTGAENVSQPVSFDDIGTAAVEKALEAFRQLGGTADNDTLAAKKRVQRPGG